ncbi:lamin tail domain-containing protein [bacterium]|nr:lamin tail domain-containing protein [bacterium]
MKSLPLAFLLAVVPVASLVAELRINEFLAANAQGLTTVAGALEDWIEIYNSGPESIDLEGYYLTDEAAFTPDDPTTFWRVPQVDLAADSYLIVFASGASESVGAELHANFKLSSDGERLALIAPDGLTILTDFTPVFPDQRRDVSYGYRIDGSLQYSDAPTPGAKNRNGVTGFVEDVTFSVKHGFYDAPFMLDLDTATEGAEIIYTLDDREAGSGTIFTGPIGETYSEPIEITKTTIVRALAKKTGMENSVLRTRTYVFLDDILNQSDQPEGFPEKWGARNPDYEMDPEIVGATYTHEEMKAALRSVPSISLVTKNDNLFAKDGIYTNSQAKDLINDGIEDKWERPVSVEFFGFPHGQTIQANAGIRIQGNASRNPNRVKHNMRVIFRADYGPGKIKFRLFEDSEVGRFNSINLRSSNGDSWINPGVRVRAQYIRDQWHREVQRRMSMPNQSQIYAHLYINGLYWGMYHVFERFEASLLSEHFGGDEDDWDALQDTPAFQDIVVNGDDVAFRKTHQLAKRDLTVQENYDELLEYVNVDNQIDYLLINFYSGNQDWDHKNMRYARRRVLVEGGAIGNGWTYFAWDSERAGFNGLNMQNLTQDTTGKKTALGPSLLNAEMHENPDYHLRFADRVVKHCYNGGELTPEGAAKSWNDLAALVYEPLLGESARWGDLHVRTPEIREGNWQTQLDRENESWFPNRTEIFLAQLARRDFIPSKLSFPQFEPFGGMIEAGSPVTMKVFNSTIFNPVNGDIYYTLSGEDPRLPDGSLRPEATKYVAADPPVVDHSLTMMARVYDSADGDWSPLAEAFFHLAEFPTSAAVIISEVHYQPVPATAEEEGAGFTTPDFEFLELTNVSNKAIDLSGVQITNGVDVTIEDEMKATLSPKAFAIIVANQAAFQLRYPDIPAEMIVGEFVDDSNLDNNGERLTISDRNGVLLHTVSYDDNAPWPSWEASEGRSLSYVGDAGPSIGHPLNWTSGPAGGTPGAANQSVPSGESLAEWLDTHGFTDAFVPVGPGRQPALLYYVFGVDEFDKASPVAAEITERESGFALTYTRRLGLDGIEWVVESSNDLREWLPELVEPQVIGTALGSETVSAPLPGAATYWRLRVSVR